MPILRRETRQRKIILQELRSTREHPTAGEIYKMAKRRMPSIGFGTVYRNLGILRDSGRILELNCGEGNRYDGYTGMHHHFICGSCRRVIDLAEPVFPGLDDRIARKFGCRVDYHRINFYGLCKLCKSGSGKKKKR